MTVLGMVDSWDVGFVAAVVVAPDGTVHRHGDTARVIPVASITKLATALATMLAVEEGALGLDDAAGPPGATVRDLLCHSAGYNMGDDRILAPPRTRRIYSNTGYEVLARSVESAVGMPFTEYLHEGVFEPLGMISSTLDGSPAAAMQSNVEDIVRLAGELSSPVLVDPSTTAAMTQPVYESLVGIVPGWGRFDPCPWGLGPELRGTKEPHWTGATASPGTYGHFGAAGSFVWTDPAVSVTCVVLTDEPFGEWALQAWPGFSDAVRRAYS